VVVVVSEVEGFHVDEAVGIDHKNVPRCIRNLLASFCFLRAILPTSAASGRWG